MRLILFCLIPLLLLAKDTHILILHSYSHDYAWTHKQDEGFVKTVKERLPKFVSFETEYLNTKRIETDSRFYKEYSDFLRYKYSDYRPDAIYVTDDNALSLIRQAKKNLFKDVPVFFSGINDLSLDLDKQQYAGVFEKKDIATNLSLIRKLFPEKKELLIIGDTSPTYTLIKEQLADLCAKTSYGFTIRYAESDHLDTILEQIKASPRSVLLLSTIGKVKDVSGGTIPLEHIIEILADTASQPLFCMEDVYMHPKIIGGYVTSGFAHGKESAKMFLKYMNGMPMQHIGTGEKATNTYLFSEQALQQFGLSLPSEIGKVATRLYQRPGFFQRHEILGYLLIYALLAVVIAGMFLFNLFILRKNRLIRRYSQTLRKSEKRLREMFDKHSAIMLLIDPITSRILDANPAAAAFYGYPIDILKAMEITQINTLNPSTVREKEEEADSERKNYFIFKHRLADGTIRDVEVHSTPITMDDQQILFSIIHDITEVVEYRTTLENKVQSEIEKRLRHEQLLIQQSKLAAMGEMINAIAHQWRQPLNALGLMVQDLPDAFKYGEMTEAYLEKIVQDSFKQITFMSSTIDDFRNFFRPDKHKSRFGVKEAIDEVLSIISAQLKAKAIAFNVEGEDFILYNHRNEFKQVILNLFNNAKDAIIDQGAPGSITVTLMEEEASHLLIVKDTGGGIPPAIRERIFEPYFTTKDQGKGTGIGLYIVKTIVEEHMDGNVSASTVDNGTEFVLRFKKNEKDSE